MGDRLPAYRDQAVTVYAGDVREVLASLHDASVDCCVTSPPYWGLRDYGIPAQVWDGDRACRHGWDATGHCRTCGAWLGHLGLEPSPDLFVQHMIDVLRGVLDGEGPGDQPILNREVLETFALLSRIARGPGRLVAQRGRDAPHSTAPGRRRLNATPPGYDRLRALPHECGPHNSASCRQFGTAGTARN